MMKDLKTISRKPRCKRWSKIRTTTNWWCSTSKEWRHRQSKNSIGSRGSDTLNTTSYCLWSSDTGVPRSSSCFSTPSKSSMPYSVIRKTWLNLKCPYALVPTESLIQIQRWRSILSLSRKSLKTWNKPSSRISSCNSSRTIWMIYSLESHRSLAEQFLRICRRLLRWTNIITMTIIRYLTLCTEMSRSVSLWLIPTSIFKKFMISVWIGLKEEKIDRFHLRWDSTEKLGRRWKTSMKWSEKFPLHQPKLEQSWSRQTPWKSSWQKCQDKSLSPSDIMWPRQWNKKPRYSERNLARHPRFWTNCRRVWTLTLNKWTLWNISNTSEKTLIQSSIPYRNLIRCARQMISELTWTYRCKLKKWGLYIPTCPNSRKLLPNPWHKTRKRWKRSWTARQMCSPGKSKRLNRSMFKLTCRTGKDLRTVVIPWRSFSRDLKPFTR